MIARTYSRRGGNLLLRDEPAQKASFLLQVQYGRRDIARRLRTTDRVNHLTEAAVSRAATERERTVIGLHPAAFYDG